MIIYSKEKKLIMIARSLGFAIREGKEINL